MNLFTSVFRVFLGPNDADPDEPTGVVEDFDWPTHREAKGWLEHGLRDMDTWRRFEQRAVIDSTLASVNSAEHRHAGENIPTGQMAIVGRDLARQLQLSTTMTRMFSQLREIEAQYDEHRNRWLEQYAELEAYLDELEARLS